MPFDATVEAPRRLVTGERATGTLVRQFDPARRRPFRTPRVHVLNDWLLGLGGKINHQRNEGP